MSQLTCQHPNSLTLRITAIAGGITLRAALIISLVLVLLITKGGAG